MKWLYHDLSDNAAAAPLQSLEDLRRRSFETLADCMQPHAERIRIHVRKASTAQQLWLLRGDIYQAVARHHCEAEAARRLNELLPAFHGWLPPQALTRL